MKRKPLINLVPVALIMICMAVTGVSWQSQPVNNNNHKNTDTIPDRKKKVRDIDDVINELDKSKVEVDQSIKNIDWPKINTEIKTALDNVHVNMADIKVEVANAIKDIDMVKIQAEVQSAIKNIDMVKIQAEIEKASKDIDVSKIQAEVAASIKNIDMEKVKADINASIANIDMDKVQKEIDQVKNIDLSKVEQELKDVKPDIEKSIIEAHKGIDQAKKELTAYKSFINELDKDGLINKNEEYKIEYNNGALTINGKKQPDSIIKKYSGFLTNHKDFIIKKDAEGFDITNPHHVSEE